jgi:hypothetical protein
MRLALAQFARHPAAAMPMAAARYLVAVGVFRPNVDRKAMTASRGGFL